MILPNRLQKDQDVCYNLYHYDIMPICFPRDKPCEYLSTGRDVNECPVKIEADRRIKLRVLEMMGEK